MARSAIDRLRQPAGQALTVLSRRLKRPLVRGWGLEWFAIGVACVLLGICTLAIASLPPRWAPLLMMATLCPFLAMIVGNVRKLFLAIILLDIPFQLDIRLGYRAEAAELGTIVGLSVSATTVCLVILYALWFAETLTKSPRPHSRTSVRTSRPLVLYLAFAGLSVIVARDPTLSFYGMFLMVQMFLLYFYVVGTVRSRQDVLFIVVILLIGLVAEALIMIWVHMAGRDFSFAGISTRVDPQFTMGPRSRGGGTIGSPNTAASYLSLLLAPALSLLMTQLGPRSKWLATLAFGLAGVALVLTFSRGGWAAFAFSATILCLLAWRRGWLRLRVAFVIAAVGLPGLLLFRDPILARLFGYDLGAAYARIPLMKLAFRMIVDNPVLGVGVNNFGAIIREYATPEFGQEWLYTVHNKYLLIWAEMGFGGLVAYVWFLVETIRRGWQCSRVNDRFLSPLALGLSAAIAGQMGHMFIDIFNSRPQVQLLWLVAGLITAMRNMSMQPDDTTQGVVEGREEQMVLRGHESLTRAD